MKTFCYFSYKEFVNFASIVICSILKEQKWYSIFIANLTVCYFVAKLGLEKGVLGYA